MCFLLAFWSITRFSAFSQLQALLYLEDHSVAHLSCKFEPIPIVEIGNITLLVSYPPPCRRHVGKKHGFQPQISPTMSGSNNIFVVSQMGQTLPCRYTLTDQSHDNIFILLECPEVTDYF